MSTKQEAAAIDTPAEERPMAPDSVPTAAPEGVPSTDFKRLLERSRQPRAIVPKTFTEVKALAEWMCTTGFVPDCYRGKPDDTAGAILYGLEIGLTPFNAVQSIAVINGRPALWGDSMLGLVRQSGLLEWIKERSAQMAGEKGAGHCQIKRKGDPTIYELEYTREMAETAGLIARSAGKDGKKLGTWIAHEGRMLQWAARRWPLRDAFGDVTKGIRLAEEQLAQATDADEEVAKLQGRAADIAVEFDIPPGDVLATMSRMGYDVDKTRAYYENGQKAAQPAAEPDEADTGPMTTAAKMAYEQAEPAGVREHTMEPETGQEPAAPATEDDAATKNVQRQKVQHQGFLDI